MNAWVWASSMHMTCICRLYVARQKASLSLLVWRLCPINHGADWPPRRSTLHQVASFSFYLHPAEEWLQTCNEITVKMAFQIRFILCCVVILHSCQSNKKPSVYIHPLWIYKHIQHNIYIQYVYFYWFLLFIGIDLNNQKCPQTPRPRWMCWIFDGPWD